jgi:hypothetical protein
VFISFLLIKVVPAAVAYRGFGFEFLQLFLYNLCGYKQRLRFLYIAFGFRGVQHGVLALKLVAAPSTPCAHRAAMSSD